MTVGSPAPLSGHAIAAMTTGVVSLVASGPLLGLGYGLHSVYLIQHDPRFELGALAVASVLLALVPLAAWAFARARRGVREGRARGEVLAGVGLATTIAGVLLPLLGLLVLTGGMVVGVAALWVGSLVGL